MTRNFEVNDIIDYQDAADILCDLPELLANERERRGLTLREVAEEIGLSHSAIFNWEHRVRTMSILNAIRVLQWLHDSAKEK